ncbi:MAG TPA: hypothetical protein VLU47_01850, partial [Blastocatellia bacterium]|nr:hypothetical protein [Blastocatellia bacterium]
MKTPRAAMPLFLIALLLSSPVCALAQEQKPAEKPKQDEAKKDVPKKADPMSPGTFAGLKLRSIGPASVGGRIIAIAV